MGNVEKGVNQEKRQLPIIVNEEGCQGWPQARSQCRWENGPVCELPTETELMARVCHYYYPEYCNGFDTKKNQGFHYDSGGRIKSWNFRSAPNIVIHILKNQVNLYNSNGVISVPISTLGDKKQNLLFFCLLILPWNPLNILGHIIHRWKDIFKENTTLLESWKTIQN